MFRRSLSALLLFSFFSLLTGCEAVPEDTTVGRERSTGDVTTYMVVYGYQTPGLFPLPRDTHTWAVFVRAFGQNLQTAALDSFTISWLPQNGKIGFGEGSEPGRNYTLQETLNIAAQKGYVVQRSPVTQIQPALYDMAASHKAVLDAGSLSGDVQYRMIDNPVGRIRVLNGLPNGFTNCIHAVSDVFVEDGVVFPTFAAHGFSASNAVFDHLSGFIVENQAFDAVLAPRMGL
jgi:hypothetical protein